MPTPYTNPNIFIEIRKKAKIKRLPTVQRIQDEFSLSSTRKHLALSSTDLMTELSKLLTRLFASYLNPLPNLHNWGD